MATRVKPRLWEPVGFEALKEAGKFYPPEVLEHIVEKAEISNAHQREQLKRAITNTMAWLCVNLHYEDRPRKTEIRAALEEARKLTVQLRCTLRRLDGDTRRELMGETYFDPDNRPNITTADIVSCDLQALADLNKRVRFALRKYENADPGAPQKEALRHAVYDLALAWVKAKGPPTRRYDSQQSREYGPFREFVNAALAPLGQQASDDMVKRAISKLNN